MRRRLGGLRRTDDALREEAARLRSDSRRIAAAALAASNAAATANRDARRAALNLLEDAEEARRAEQREAGARQRASEALYASEEKYRGLFNSIDEGFAIVELIYDEAGRAVDYRFLEVNPAFAKQTGVRDAVGRRVREVAPGHERFWFETYAQVARTGVPIRFEHHAASLGRWFDAYAFRAGEARHGPVAVVLTDITARRQAAEALRVSEARQRLLVRLGDALRSLTGTREVQAAASRLLGEHLGADRVFDCDIDEAQGQVILRPGYQGAGLDSLEGRRYPLANFPDAVAALRGGQTISVPDVPSWRGIAEPTRLACAALGIRALATAPLLREGRLVWAFNVAAAAAREWTPEELALIQDVAERTWEAVERARAIEALRLSEARFRTLTDAVPQVIWANEAKGQANYFNWRWFEYSGLSLDSSVGPGWQAIVHADDAPGSVSRWESALAAGATFNTEYRLRRADGAYRWHLGRNVPLKDDDGRVLGWFGTATDIHDLKETEAAFAAAQEHLRLIVNSAVEHAIISLDREGRVTSWNPGAERIFGYEAGEMMGRTLDVICTPEDTADGHLKNEARRALAEGRAGGENWLVRRDGTRLWANCAMLPMTARPGGEPSGFVKILRDETAALQARQALEQTSLFLRDALHDAERARAEAVAAGEAKDHFLAVLSHELRTPLMPILMAVGTLARRTDLPPMIAGAFEMIQRNVQLEARFIDELLDMTRISRGKMEIVRREMDLHEAARRAVEVSMPDIQEKEQRLTVVLDAANHVMSGDFARLQQAMWNLLKNASKFTPEGGAIRLSTRDEPSRVVVEITDTGIGMEPEATERIFRAFEQADRSITQQFGGLGLGLAIAKGTVEAHGGELSAASPGRGLGATFTVSLPLSGQPG